MRKFSGEKRLNKIPKQGITSPTKAAGVLPFSRRRRDTKASPVRS